MQMLLIFCCCSLPYNREALEIELLKYIKMHPAEENFKNMLTNAAVIERAASVFAKREDRNEENKEQEKELKIKREDKEDKEEEKQTKQQDKQIQQDKHIQDVQSEAKEINKE